MLMQDTLTGYIHEVPDGPLYGSGYGDYGEYGEPMGEGQIVYDGLGNPVGFLTALKRFARKAVSRLAPVVSQLAPFVPIPGAAALTQVAQRVLPGLVRRLTPAAQRLVHALPAGVVQQFAPVAQAFQQPVPAVAPAMGPGGSGPEDMGPADDVEGYYGAVIPPRPAPWAMRRPLVRRMPPGWVQHPVPYPGQKGRRVYLRCALWHGPRGLVPAWAAHAPAATGPVPGAPVPGAPVPYGPGLRHHRHHRRIVRRRH